MEERFSRSELFVQAIAKALEGINLDSGKELHRVIRVSTVSSLSALHQQLHSLLPGLRSPWGALLLLFSLLLSRGLVSLRVSCGISYSTWNWASCVDIEQRYPRIFESDYIRSLTM